MKRRREGGSTAATASLRRQGYQGDEGDKKKKSGKESVGKLKKQIRAVQRLLRVEALPPTVVQENERKLEMLQNKLVNLQASKVSDKYKMVRFFEKRKLFRRLKSALNSEEPDEEVVQGIRDKINYIVYYPLGEKYISLLPKEAYTDDAVIAKQTDLLTTIKGRVASGELDDASSATWSKDRNLTQMRSLQATDLNRAKRRIHSQPAPEPPAPSSDGGADDFFLIDRG